jgi:hypothetical protein
MSSFSLHLTVTRPLAYNLKNIRKDTIFSIRSKENKYFLIYLALANLQIRWDGTMV